MAKAIDAESIIDKYYMDIYKFCCARTKDAEAAMDLTQETFLVFTAKRDQLVDNNIRAWLLSVANNKLREYFRKQAVENKYIRIEDINPRAFEEYGQEQIDENLIFDDVQKKILNILNDKEKELFIKLYIENKSVSLIREELDLTEENFRARKSRLNKKIKKSFEHIYFFFLVVSFKIFH